MNILIVDDDRFVLEGIRKGIDWSSMPFEQLFMAQSARQAKAILEKVPVAVLVSDIEMPSESGLELLAWVREQKLALQSILLTSYAEFSYAQKAVELGSFHYFLKPIEYPLLKEIILQAAEKAAAVIEQDNLMIYRELWSDQSRNIRENFFSWLIRHAEEIDSNELRYQIRKYALPYSPSSPIVVILCEMHMDQKQAELWKESLREFTFRNIAEELLTENNIPAYAILQVKKNRYCIIAESVQAQDAPERLEATLKKLIASCLKALRCSLTCYVYSTVDMEHISLALYGLTEIAANTLSVRDAVIYSRDYRQTEMNVVLPDMKELELFLENGNLAGMLKITDQFLISLDRQQITSEALLKTLKYDIHQMIFASLRKEQIDAHRVMTSSDLSALEQDAVHSVQNMRRYLVQLFCRAIDSGRFSQDSRSVSERLMQYVQEHIGDNITRADLASYVFLNEDYLARVFKQETGISIGNYILSQKMERARIMLAATDKSVNVIARELGYDSTSYFAKMFRRVWKMTPVEYRKSLSEPPEQARQS